MRNFLKYLLLIQSLVYAQTRKDLDLNRFLEQNFTSRGEAINFDALYENFYQLYRNPLDLNQVEADDLAALYVLSTKQIQSFINYRATNGALLSLYELQAVPDFDLETIYQILPFVTVDVPTKKIKDLLHEQAPNHYLLFRTDRTLEQRKGFTPSTIYQGKPTQRYLGSAERVFIRYRLSDAQNYSFGFTAEKDAGEQWTWQPNKRQYGADFYSFHAQIKNRKHWKNIILGDYQLQFGQGLVLASGFYLGKSSETVYAVRRSHLGIRPYTSTIEGDFFRGFAATYQVGKIEITGFYSNINRDANVNESNIVTSLLTGGLHRTTPELGDKGALQEQNFGFNVFKKWRNGNAGFTHLQTHFALPILKRNLPYNDFEFQGKSNQVLGVHFNQFIRNWNIFGEAARSAIGGIGAIVGLMAVPNKRNELAVVFRNYDKNFHSFYANAFGEYSRNINERGFYVGVKHQINRQYQLSAYLDYFSFPWLRYLVDAPSKGRAYLFRASYRPNKQFDAFAQWSFEQNAKNLTINKIKSVTNTYRNTFLANASYRPSRAFSVRSRVQFNNFYFAKQPKSAGFALLQDADFQLKRGSITGRVAYFDTDDYDARIYAYERDVLYAVSFPFYMNQGWRQYLILQYPLRKNVDIWLRLARTQLLDQETISSDLNEIPKPHQTDVRLQLRLKL